MRFRLPTGAARAQSVLILSVFVLFVINALGVLDLSALPAGRVGFNEQVLLELLSGRMIGPLNRADVVAFMAVGLALALLLPSLPPIGASLLTLAAMVPPFYAAWNFPVPPPLIPLEYTLLTVLVLFSVNVLSSYFIENRQRQRIVAAFGQYVPPMVAREISRHPEAFSMAGEARVLTVLFCDIKRFTAIAEHLGPRELAEMLNHHLSAMTDVLHAHGATIDKYIGDAIMAFWGAPVAQPDHAARAVAAALDMQSGMHRVREACAGRGWPEVEIGIGIASGMMNVGNMGSRYRVAYTVIGDAVNLAARVEALTRLYGVGILVTESTREAAAGTTRFREVDHVRVKGKSTAHRLFEPLPEGGVDETVLALHASGLDAYYRGDWQRAVAAFSELARREPHAAYYRVMLERMASREVPAEWDGIVSFGAAFDYSVALPADAAPGAPA